MLQSIGRMEAYKVHKHRLFTLTAFLLLALSVSVTMAESSATQPAAIQSVVSDDADHKFYAPTISSTAVPSYKVLHNFAGYPIDGDDPDGSLIASGSILYGMTCEGGAYDEGTIFAYNINTGVETVLHSFGDRPSDGVKPSGSLIASGSILYGMTCQGGIHDAGTIFAFNRTNKTEAILHSFGSSGDGDGPWGSLIQSGSTLYGTTQTGGADGDGALFAYNINTSVEIILHSFDYQIIDGISPGGSLIKSGPILYGMTRDNTDVNWNDGNGDNDGIDDHGVIFAYNASGGPENLLRIESVLHVFGAFKNDGAGPQGSLIQSGSTLYGMTRLGGENNDGTIFSFNLANDSETVLHSFYDCNDDGARPNGSLIQSGSMLYGMTEYGGAYFDEGTIFAYNINTGVETILHSFYGDGGDNPEGDLLLLNSTLYGMAHIGGDKDHGTIFALTLPKTQDVKNTLAIVVTSNPNNNLGNFVSPETILDHFRSATTAIYTDKKRPMGERMEAFDLLEGTFNTGTPQTVVNRYVTIDSMDRNDPDSDYWIGHVTEPDGSVCFYPFYGDPPDDAVVDLGGERVSPQDTLNNIRDTVAGIYTYQIWPIDERVLAFDLLLGTFTSGTPKTVIDKYVKGTVVIKKSGIVLPQSGGIVLLRMTAPDGTSRFIRLHGDCVQ